MPEQLRNQIDKPSFYTDALEGGNQAAGGEYGRNVTESARPIVATQDHEAIAYDVAHAIKPDIDQVVALEQQKKAHNPLEGASYMEIDGQKRLTGATPFGSEPNLVAAKADLERNAKNASEIAAEQHLGATALDLVKSKQEVANWRRL